MSALPSAAVEVAAPSRARIRWIGFQTIVLREMGRILRIWGQTIVPSAVTAALYFVIFGSLIGSRIGQMDGIDYKDVDLFKEYIAENAKIMPARLTGTKAGYQRLLSVAIKRARFLALLPYTDNHQ